MSHPQRPLGAQMSHALKARGVDVIFGIPGVHNIELYRGIEEAGITHVLTRHEQGAGFMADGYARATGKPGVAYVITGPGLCNIMTPMGQAYSDSVPMLVISSCLEREHRSLAHGRLHEMLDQEAAAATVCEWSVTAPDARGAFQLIDQAFMEFKSKRPRPKHIQVPIDVLGALSDPAPSILAEVKIADAPQDAVNTVFGLLDAAKRPLIVLGGGAVSSPESTNAARALMDLCGAACFSTYAGGGLIARDHPLNFTSTLGRGGSKDIIASADLVIAIGTQLAEVDLWRDFLGHSAPMVRVDVDPAVLSDWHRAEVPIFADATKFMQALAARFEGIPQEKNWTEREVTAAKARFRAETDAERPGLVPILDAIQAALPADTTIYSDMTQLAYVGKEVYAQDNPNLWHHPTGFGTLGYGLPAAIGGKIGLGDAPVVAIAG
ncbi:MAG: 5-guanidino-2-oxopentanoate decarboxylase, partial [Paracoccaceae bacterium]